MTEHVLTLMSWKAENFRRGEMNTDHARSSVPYPGSVEYSALRVPASVSVEYSNSRTGPVILLFAIDSNKMR